MMTQAATAARATATAERRGVAMARGGNGAGGGASGSQAMEAMTDQMMAAAGEWLVIVARGDGMLMEVRGWRRQKLRQ